MNHGVPLQDRRFTMALHVHQSRQLRALNNCRFCMHDDTYNSSLPMESRTLSVLGTLGRYEEGYWLRGEGTEVVNREGTRHF